MSPSEFDLRAALHDGEGEDEGIDVHRIVAAGQARRARRTRALSVTAVTAAVAGVGITAGLLWGGGSTGSSGASGRQAGASGGQADGKVNSQEYGTAAGASSQHGAANGPLAAEQAGSIACPNPAPHYLLPGGGSPGQFGAGGSLFGSAVSSVVVCGYGAPSQALNTTSAPAPARLVLTGTSATGLVQSLENADRTRSVRPCPLASAGRAAQVLAIIGVAADGRTTRAVTTTLTDPACNVTVTNGTAVRYQWQPPTALLNQLLALTPHG